jgi:flagellar hook-length control protein FliK
MANTSSADAAGVAQDQGDGAAGSSFQKMMSQAQAGESQPVGGEPAAATPAAAAAAGAVDALAGEVARATAAAATAAATLNPMTQLRQFAGQATGAADAAAPQLATTLPKQVSSDSDADAVPQDDSLVLVLASLAQLGITPQPATAAAAPTSDSGTSLSVAVGAAATQLAGALPRLTNGVADGLAARLRPGAAGPLPAAANGDATGAAVPLAAQLQLDPSAGSITIRDLLDGSGDAASRARDPAETTTASRPLDGAGVLAAAANDMPRTAEAVARTISVPVQHPRWAEAVSTEIRWFAEQGVQSATLRLNPEHMGPVDVRLSLSDSQVTVNFSAASAETRAALEQSLPRLREMLAGAGLSLGEAQVQQQMRQGSQNGSHSAGGAADTDVRDSMVRVPQRLGLVDEYA